MDTELAQYFDLGYPNIDGIDLVGSDQKEAYEIKAPGRGVRDLRNAAVALASFLARNPGIESGYVLTSLIRIGAARVRAEWESIKQIVRPDLAARMHLVAVVDGTELVESASLRRTPVVDRFLSLTKKTTRTPSSASTTDAGPYAGPLSASWKHLEVEKLLLHRWLLDEGPIAIGTLIRQVGCSYPTALQAIKRLSASDLIDRGRGRSVALAKYPRDRWLELFRAQRLVYAPFEFVDPAAAPGAIDDLLHRLARLKPQGVAIGGVVAARHWDPAFDLNGTPRIDLVIHASGHPRQGGIAPIAADLARQLDPALKRRVPKMPGATLLVVHSLRRKDPLFTVETLPALPFADPVEVLYHLNELGLTAQAGQLIQHLRQTVKS